MKNLKKIYIISFCIIVLLTITGCKKKKISIEEFNKKMTNDGYTIKDLGEEEKIKKSSLAVDSDNQYEIYFYEFNNFDDAKSIFYDIKDSVSKLAVKGSTSGIIERKKYLKYVLTNNDYYYVISTIDNTLVFGVTNVDNKNNLKNIIKKIGY